MPYADLPGDLRMYYEDDDFTDPWRSSETVILLHGQAKSSQLWHAWVPLLARDYRVIRIDNRGYGRSTQPPPDYAWSFEEWATDVKNLMDHLGIESAHVIGETIGGVIGFRLALEHPERVRSLTTCNTPYLFGSSTGTRQRYYDLVDKTGVEGWARETIAIRLTPGKVDPAAIEWYIGEMGKTSRRTFLETLTYLGTLDDMTPMLTRITVPTLVIDGAEPGQYTDAARLEASTIPGCRLVEIPGVSGFVAWEAPEQAAAAWREFAGSLK